MGERELELLKGLMGHLEGNEEVDQVSLFTAEELNAPMPVVRAFLPGFGASGLEVLAEFFFLPGAEGDPTLRFSSVLTITNILPQDRLPEVDTAVARLNCYLPVGAYCVNRGGSHLLYKLVIPMGREWTKASQERMVCLAAEEALLTPRGTAGLLVSVALGELSLGDFLESLPER